jgi:hypothetical protein
MRMVTSVAVAASFLAGCSAGPVAPTPPRAAAPPTTVAAAPPPRPNTAPSVVGDLRCISPVGAPHVFPLTLVDEDGDRLSWTAAKERPQGDLLSDRGDGVPAGETITVTYVPPGVDRDENWIRLTVTDGRGGETTVTLYVKNH